jgi:hypothetical protein
LPFALFGFLSLRNLLVSLITILPNLLLTIRGADLRESREYLKNERINLTNSHILNQAKLVSSPEGLMPALTYAGFRDIDYFPIGLGHSDVAFVPYVDSSFEEVEISLYGQVLKVDRGEWSSINSAILKEKYNHVESYTGPLGSIAVYQLKF